MPGQEISTLTYNRTDITPTTVVTEYRYSGDADNGNKQRIEQYMGLNSAAVAQKTTVTIAAGVNGNAYVVIVASNGVTRTYRHEQATGDTAASIANFLATIISTHLAVTAASENNVITISACVAGIPFTTANTGSTTVGNLVMATPTANSGTPKHRKRWDITLTFDVSAQGFERVTATGTCLDGAEPPVAANTFGPLVLANAQTGIATVQSRP